ncbi:MAG: hypothetical protein KAW46_05485 [candidate division Zixibacteria bacterium]|nr:hypothetical protein [candidate division Zixibacteria bacterium]
MPGAIIPSWDGPHGWEIRIIPCDEESDGVYCGCDNCETVYDPDQIDSDRGEEEFLGINPSEGSRDEQHNRRATNEHGRDPCACRTGGLPKKREACIARRTKKHPALRDRIPLRTPQSRRLSEWA